MGWTKDDTNQRIKKPREVKTKMEHKNHLKKAVLLLTLLGLLYTGITSVLGVQGATSISLGQSSRANLTNYSSSASTAVQAGNVTELNISGQAITTHWAGFYGEISGNITLENANGDVFYDWTGLNALVGEVFASPDSTVQWDGIGCANASEISSIESSLGISATDADNIASTYSSNSHPSFDVGTVTGITGCNSTNTYVKWSILISVLPDTTHRQKRNPCLYNPDQ